MPPQVTVTRRHHPLEGQRFEVVTGGPTQVVVRVADGTSMRLPRAWTDAGGPASAGGADRVFSIDALVALLGCLDALGRRA